jgi:hypothetical protein
MPFSDQEETDMTEPATFPCSRCQAPIPRPPDANQFYAACPACGIVNRIPVVRQSHPLRTTMMIMVLLILVVAICWTVTVTIGGQMIQPEIGATLSQMKVGPDTVLHIRAPLPFIVSFRLAGTQTKSGVHIGITITKYYFWYVKDYRELREAQTMPALKWVWAR